MSFESPDLSRKQEFPTLNVVPGDHVMKNGDRRPETGLMYSMEEGEVFEVTGEKDDSMVVASEDGVQYFIPKVLFTNEFFEKVEKTEQPE